MRCRTKKDNLNDITMLRAIPSVTNHRSVTWHYQKRQKSA